MSEHPPPAGPRLLVAGSGEVNGPDDHGSHDRFMIKGADSGGRFAVVEHVLGPHVLAAPRILEIISPAGLEDLFRQFGSDGYPDPEVLAMMAAEHGAKLDFVATMPIVERHGLAF